MQKSIDEIIKESDRFLNYIVHQYNGYGMDHNDLYQEGAVGMVMAYHKFNPDVGAPFLSYATHWVRARIQEHILRNYRVVNGAKTHDRRKLFFNVRKLKGASPNEFLTNKEAEEMAEKLNVTTKDVLMMDYYMSSSGKELTPNTQSADDGDEYTLELPDSSLDPAILVSEAEHHLFESERLQEALSSLPDRERDIIENRVMCDKEDKIGLDNFGKKYGISGERIRQLEVSALKKLKSFLLN